jgi:hypothetical protein
MTPRKLTKQANSTTTKLKSIVIELNCCCRIGMTGWLADAVNPTGFAGIVFHSKRSVA